VIAEQEYLARVRVQDGDDVQVRFRDVRRSAVGDPRPQDTAHRLDSNGQPSDPYPERRVALVGVDDLVPRRGGNPGNDVRTSSIRSWPEEARPEIKGDDEAIDLAGEAPASRTEALRSAHPPTTSTKTATAASCRFMIERTPSDRPLCTVERPSAATCWAIRCSTRVLGHSIHLAVELTSTSDSDV
jgi:hypothetical protein